LGADDQGWGQGLRGGGGASCQKLVIGIGRPTKRIKENRKKGLLRKKSENMKPGVGTTSENYSKSKESVIPYEKDIMTEFGSPTTTDR